MRVANTLLDSGVRDRDRPPAGELLIGAQLERSCDSKRNVALLMLAGERRVDMQRLAFKRKIVDVARKRRSVCAGGKQRCEIPRWRKAAGCIDAADVEPHSRLANRRVGFLMLRERDEHPVLAEDARLLSGDLANGVAQILCVVDADVGDDADDGLDGVSSVKPATQAHFEHG